MRKVYPDIYAFVFLLISIFAGAQSPNPAPYCNGNYTSGNCLQGGPPNTQGNGVNDFIDIFKTSGGDLNINNSNSGCNGNPNNYANYCQHYLQVTPGQVITCTLQSGIIFSQGFAIWVDWDQNNVFQNPGERVAATTNVPAAGSSFTLGFTIPPGTPNGVYRLRVRCAFATPGTNITPCGTFGFGETEDYSIYVGPITNTGGIISATAIAIPSVVCVGQPITFSVNTPYLGALSYTWTGPASFSSTLLSPSIPSAAASSQGIYTVVISNTICPVTRTVQTIVVPYPVISTVPPSSTICQGGNLVGGVNVPGALTNYSYQWLGPAGSISSPLAPNTLLTPPLQPAAITQTMVMYSVLVTPTIYPCTSIATLAVYINNPMTPTISLPGPLCSTTTPIQLFATPGGGTWSANTAGMSPGGILTPSLTPANGSVVVSYSTNIGLCVSSNTAQVDVSKYHSPALTAGIPQRCSLDSSYNLMNIAQDPTSGRWSGINVTSNNRFVSAGLPTGTYTLTYKTLSRPDTNVCSSYTTIAVTVFNPPTPTINLISPACTNGTTVQVTALPAGGTWSGNSGISTGGILTPSNCGVGPNTVTYSAGQNTCTASSSRTFEISRFNTAALTGNLPSFCFNSAPFNLNSIVQYTGGSWSGISVNSNNFFSPAGLPTNAYQLKYRTQSFPNTGLCPDSVTAIANVLNPPTPVIGVAGPFCQKDAPVQLTVSPMGGQWLTAPYLTAGGVFIPSLSAVGSNFVQYAIGNNTCQAKSSIMVSVEQFVPAKITGKIPDLCNNSPVVSLAPFSSIGGNWTGPGVAGGNFNPALSNAGNFYIFHQTSSVPGGLCPDRDSMAINVYSLAPPVISQAGPFCNNSLPVQLQVSPLGGIFDGTNTKAVNNEGLFSPYSGVIGKNVISYSIASGPCIAYASTTVMVSEFVSAQLDVQPPSVMCINAEPIDMTAFVHSRGGTWSGPGMVNGSSMFFPTYANLGPNNVLRYYTHAAGNATLCPDESSVKIEVRSMPKASIVTGSLTGCTPLQVTFNSPENQTGNGLWVFDDGVSKTGLSAVHIFTRTGQYNIVFRYEDPEAPGCTATAKLSSPVEVYARPRADFDFSNEDVTIVEPKITLINRTNPVGENKYVWTVFGMEQYFSVNPVITFPKAGTYRVNLEATNYRGCKSEVTKLLEVKNDFNVFIPNSFTPNFDGKNDVFKPVFSPFGLDYNSYYMRIFNRWGQLVFETNDHNEGWDGTPRNFGDTNPKNDTYTYEIRFGDIEGKTYEKRGTIMVLR